MAKSGSSKSLVIVESPAKAKTINKYLGPEYEVQASMGHVRDLPSSGLNIDIEHDFEPTYEISRGKKKVINSLKSAAKKCDRLYLATDLDREGEAIAWHLAQLLNMPDENTYRVVFNSITKDAIKQAFSDPGKLNMDRVLAQQARRVLDRIVGYEISPLLWKKVARGLSAGRVQSVAVKMIVEKEREIRAFDPDEYWLIPAVFTTETDKDYSADWKAFLESAEDEKKGRTLAEQYEWLRERNAFKAELTRVNGDKFHADNEEDAHKIFNAIRNGSYSVADKKVKRVSSRPSPPFITSTLQQAAANRLGFTAKRTMSVAQQLYEGVELGSMGAIGLITYMRTDSTHISGEAISAVRRHIGSDIGPNYVPEKPNFFTSKKGAQEAHEAIRPTDPSIKPGDAKPYLNDQQFKLYDLIWRRFVACQMEKAQWDTTTIEIEAKTEIGPCTYRTNGRVQVFDGFTRVWRNTSNDQDLPSMEVSDPLAAVDVNAEQHFTKPPARYTEASLVKALEREGIGRPSTYASIISTIQDRKYVEKLKNKFYATDLGEVVTDKLAEFFPKIMDIAFTRHMEGQLDEIEEHHLDWVNVLNEFYGPFKENLETAKEEMKHAKAETTPSEYTCPECEAPMVYRFGKNGRFLSCSKYPDCKFACPCDREGKMVKEEVTEHKCPNCEKPMVVKSGRFGKFLGCSDYPQCKTIMNIDKEGNVQPPKAPPEPTGIKCYKCKKGELVIRQSKRGPFLGCNKFPRCRTIVSMKQLDNLKKLQEEGKWPPETWEEADEMLGRKKSAKKKSKKKKAKKKTAKKKTAKKKTAKKKTKKKTSPKTESE
ncbi:DNA topoisomerase 1 [Anaerohalosphaera lusitana]|uniref:DNA topoisomerase 1 n=1 Tax=Anaerohalosphaera lusitana TaxID=1936003 RepID=A0A1U9NQX1_9BACT|nr:type I DNA topoisomerase [Anaerohalosphaera lusitana]AQT70215.1 DNA topoisomerase 1 [Anaerohalosphaera lusitana]